MPAGWPGKAGAQPSRRPLKFPTFRTAALLARSVLDSGLVGSDAASWKLRPTSLEEKLLAWVGQARRSKTGTRCRLAAQVQSGRLARGQGVSSTTPVGSSPSGLGCSSRVPRRWTKWRRPVTLGGTSRNRPTGSPLVQQTLDLRPTQDPGSRGPGPSPFSGWSPCRRPRGPTKIWERYTKLVGERPLPPPEGQNGRRPLRSWVQCAGGMSALLPEQSLWPRRSPIPPFPSGGCATAERSPASRGGPGAKAIRPHPSCASAVGMVCTCRRRRYGPRGPRERTERGALGHE